VTDRLALSAGTAAAAGVVVFLAWFGANVACSNRYSCTSESCTPCEPIAVAGWFGLGAVVTVALVTYRWRWGYLAVVLAGGIGVLAVVIVSRGA